MAPARETSTARPRQRATLPAPWPAGAPARTAVTHRRDRRGPNRMTNSWPVGQQPNKRTSVGPTVRATEPEQNDNLFGVPVSLSRGGPVKMLGPHQSSGSNPGPNEDPRDRSLLHMT